MMPSLARLACLALAVAGAAALPMSARKKHTLAETFKSIESDIAALERASASRSAAPAGLERMQENTCEVKDGCFTDGNQLREAMGEPKRKELAYNQALDEYKKKDAEEENISAERPGGPSGWAQWRSEVLLEISAFPRDTDEP